MRAPSWLMRKAMALVAPPPAFFDPIIANGQDGVDPIILISYGGIDRSIKA